MASLRETLAASSTDAALRHAAEARPKLFGKVAELRDAHLKDRDELSSRSRDSYASDARRVANAGGDPTVLAGCSASFRKLRAACIWKCREDLRECLARADRTRKKGGVGELEALCIYDENLGKFEQRLAFLAALKFDLSRAKRIDKTHMQRHKLGRLPKSWIADIHSKTRGGKYGLAVAVGILIPVRPEEVSNRIRIRVDDSGAMVFEVQGSKLRAMGSGVAARVVGIGQPARWLTLSGVDQSRQDTFNWLRDQVVANGGKLSVGCGISASGMCSAFRSMSRRLFKQLRSPPSFYALRHAACAELKAAGLDPTMVAEGMGHASTASQQAYGMSSQGSGSYRVKAEASSPVRIAAPTGSRPSLQRRSAPSRVHARRPGP